MFFLCFLVIILLAFAFFFLGKAPPAKNILWGVNFSQKHAELMGLDWRETFSALIGDLGAKNIKIGTHWDLLEPKKEEYNFSDLDWQISEVEKAGAKAILAFGMKTPRWPECHIPEWAKGLSKNEQQGEILSFIRQFVLRYKGSSAVSAWQIENEPFFSFGECPWRDDDFFKKEAELVRSLDDSRPLIVSDSGEMSLWLKAAKYGDIVSTTLYRKVWSTDLNTYFTMPFPPVYYYWKAELIKNTYGKPVICGELQAEPWGRELLYYSTIEEQRKTMDLGKFKKVVSFAKKTGLDTFYFWGSEWWFYMKTRQSQPEIWNEAKDLF